MVDAPVLKPLGKSFLGVVKEGLVVEDKPIGEVELWKIVMLEGLHF